MADHERIPLTREPGWVDIKLRWTYGDRVFCGRAPSFEQAMLHRCVVAWSKDGALTPEALDKLDDSDAGTIIERIAYHRRQQLGLPDPNAGRASSRTSPEERSGPSGESGPAVSSSP